MDRKEFLDWIRETYAVEPDYPWNDWNAVLRHKDNKKWFALVMEVEASKLGLPGEKILDVLNVKCDPILIGSLRLQKGFLPAYHMNKDSWISILLDGSAPDEEIKNLTDLSYKLTWKRKVENKFYWTARLFVDGREIESKYFQTQEERDSFVLEHSGWKRRGKICAENLEKHLKENESAKL